MYRNITVNKETVIRLFLIIINVAIAATIFILSAQPADVSGPMSCGVVFKLISPVLSKFSYSSEEILSIAEMLNGIARKMAHFSIYAVFGMFMYLLLSRYNLKNKCAFFFSNKYKFFSHY